MRSREIIAKLKAFAIGEAPREDFDKSYSLALP
jgi:hypothetical protein